MTQLQTLEPTAVHIPAPRLSDRSRGGASSAEYLTFRLGQEEYAIDILAVQEIRGYEQPTRIAGAPVFVKGVINLRGVIVPIVDLRLKFDLANAVYDGFTVVIIVNVARRVVGMVVDGVSDVVALAADAIRQAPAFNATVDADFIDGIAAVPGLERERMLILADIERLVQSSELGLVAA